MPSKQIVDQIRHDVGHTEDLLDFYKGRLQKFHDERTDWQNQLDKVAADRGDEVFILLRKILPIRKKMTNEITI